MGIPYVHGKKNTYRDTHGISLHSECFQQSSTTWANMVHSSKQQLCCRYWYHILVHKTSSHQTLTPHHAADAIKNHLADTHSSPPTSCSPFSTSSTIASSSSFFLDLSVSTLLQVSSYLHKRSCFLEGSVLSPSHLNHLTIVLRLLAFQSCGCWFFACTCSAFCLSFLLLLVIWLLMLIALLLVACLFPPFIAGHYPY